MTLASVSQQEIDLAQQAKGDLEYLCLQITHRRVGSPGNRAATDYVARRLISLGLTVEQPEFTCLDWEQGGASLFIDGESFEVFPSPYTSGCLVQAPLVVISTLEELETIQAENSLLLLHGELAREQLIPKNFPFYRPEEHLRIIGLLENKHPVGIIAATGRNPELAGAAYPFPLIEDGDFNIPSVFMTEEEGNRLASYAGRMADLAIRARRIPATGRNVIARYRPDHPQRVVVCAHIDAKEDTPGGLDNASGVVVLLLIVELLKSYQGKIGVEIFVINGEDHYSAAGEIQYLQANQGKLGEVLLAINLDMVGDYQSLADYSLYGCPEGVARVVRTSFKKYPRIQEGSPWYQGDHMVFFQNGVPAVALTSSRIVELMANITHTERDTPELVDPGQLVGIAEAIRGVIADLS